MSRTTSDLDSSIDPISIFHEDALHSSRRLPSPAKSIVLEQRSEHTSSPWRLRIAVEPEPEDPRERSIMPAPYINREVVRNGKCHLRSPSRVAPGQGNQDVGLVPGKSPSGTTFVDIISTGPNDFKFRLGHECENKSADDATNSSSSNRRLDSNRIAPSSAIHAPGDTTIMESEDFSMVSVASLDSHRTASNQIRKTIASTLRNQDSEPDVSAHSISSPGMAQAPTVTPDVADPVPSLPARARKSIKAGTAVQTPQRNNVVRSGRVLQDIVRTPDNLHQSSIEDAVHADERPHAVSNAVPQAPVSATRSVHRLPTPVISQQAQRAAMYSDQANQRRHPHSATQLDPMSWIATGAPKLASPISPTPIGQDQNGVATQPVPPTVRGEHVRARTSASSTGRIENKDASDVDLWQEEASRPQGSGRVSPPQVEHGNVEPPSPDDSQDRTRQRDTRVDSVEPDHTLLKGVVTPQATQSGITCDDTGIFWKGATTRAVTSREVPLMDEPSYLNSPFTGSDHSLLQGTVIDPSPQKQRHDTTFTTTQESSESRLDRSSEHDVEDSHTKTNETIDSTESTESTSASSDSVGKQLLDDLQRQQTRRCASSISSSHASLLSNRSYEEQLNKDSPGRVTVDFNDSIDAQSTMPMPQTDLPHLFDNTIPHLTPRRHDSDADVTDVSSDPLSDVTPTPKNGASRAQLSVLSPVSPPEAETTQQAQALAKTISRSPARHSTPDPILRLRRKYGVHDVQQPLTYAHVRTLHRMLNSVRHHKYATIIPVQGPLPPSLAAEETPVMNKDILHAIHAFMTLLLPKSEIDYLERNGEWGDDETQKARGKDSKGRRGSSAVFGTNPDVDAEHFGGRIREEWIVEVVRGIMGKEVKEVKAGRRGGGTVKTVA